MQNRAYPQAVSAVLVLLFAALLFCGLGSAPMAYFDEIKGAERAREFLVSGDPWVVQTNFKPSFNKPPLHYWLTAATLEALPDREFAVRFWTACFAVGCVALTAALAAKLLPDTPWAAPWAAGFVALYGPFLEYSRIGLLDAGITFWTLATLLAAEAARRRPILWLGAGLCAGLGSLYKFPLPLAAMILWTAAELSTADGRQLLRSRPFWSGLALALVLTVIWPAIQIVRFGDGWWEVYGKGEAKSLLQRQQKMQTFGLFTYWAWLGMKWLLFGAVSIAGLGWAIWRGRSSRLFGPAVFAAVYLIVISLFTSKSHRYAFPALPILAICGVAFVASRRLPASIRIGALTLCAFAALPIGFLHYTKERELDLDPQQSIVENFGRAAKPEETLLIVRSSKQKKEFLVENYVLFMGNLRQPVRTLSATQAGKALRDVPGPLRGLAGSSDWETLQTALPRVREVAQEHGVVHFATESP